MSTLKVPGAQLYYEGSGDGSLLILIPGAKGEAEVFRPLAHLLSAQYQVVIYDRRGFSRSTLDGPQDYDHRLSTDADDVWRKSPQPAHLIPELTEHEREILTLIAQGYTNPAIAEHLILSLKTVRNHVSSIFSKLQVAGRAEAIIRSPVSVGVC